MSGTQSAITALNFSGTAFSMPFTIFMPITWAQGNSNGAAQVNGPMPFQADVTPYGTGITPDLLSASQANFAEFNNNALATISNLGAYQFTTAAGLFSNWANNLNSIASRNADIFGSAVSAANARANMQGIGALLGGGGSAASGVASLALAFL